jgi:hypothetical protein
MTQVLRKLVSAIEPQPRQPEKLGEAALHILLNGGDTSSDHYKALRRGGAFLTQHLLMLVGCAVSSYPRLRENFH